METKSIWGILSPYGAVEKTVPISYRCELNETEVRPAEGLLMPYFNRETQSWIDMGSDIQNEIDKQGDTTQSVASILAKVMMDNISLKSTLAANTKAITALQSDVEALKDAKEPEAPQEPETPEEPVEEPTEPEQPEPTPEEDDEDVSE